MDLLEGTKQSLNALNVQRKSLELEADAIVSELTARSPGGGEPMGVDTPLVDAEGYPRADIDIYRARSLRKRLAEIRTDHKNMMGDIEKTLAQLAALQNPEKVAADRIELEARLEKKPKPKFDPVSGKWVVRNWDGTVAGTPGGERRSFHNLSSSSESKKDTNRTESVSTTSQTTSVPSSPIPDSPVLPDILPSRPFARIDSVAEDSPAQHAGLQVDDLVLLFDQVSIDSSSNPMGELAELVPRVAGAEASIDIVVQRATRGTDSAHPSFGVNAVRLKPRPWKGKGLIGMHILPV